MHVQGISERGVVVSWFPPDVDFNCIDGYEVVYKRDPDAYPELANDLDNVQIVAKLQSQRRRMLEN